MGPIINTILGAAIKLGCNLINAWLEHRQQNQMLMAARDKAVVDALLNNQQEQAKDPFVKITRRILFMSITFTMCFLMIYYAMNPHISYDIIVPKGEGARWGIFSWIFWSERLGDGFNDRGFITIFFYGFMLYGCRFLCSSVKEEIE